MSVHGIGGIFFKSEDPQALSAWYEEHLGLRRDDDGHTVLGWRELGRPDRIGHTVWSPFAADTDYFAPSDSDWMVNFRVDDLAATLERLRKEGVTVVGEPESFEYGKFGWVLDAEGNKVELWEPPEEHSFETTVPETPQSQAGAPAFLCAPGDTIATTADGMAPEDLVRQRTFAVSVAEAWRLWTTGDGLAEWLVEANRVELRVGGPYELYFNADGEAGARGSEGCKVLSFLPEKMLSFTWNAPPHLEYTRNRLTHVVVEFEATGSEETRVRLTHLGWPSEETDAHPQWQATLEYFDSAWTSVFDAFEAHAETK